MPVAPVGMATTAPVAPQPSGGPLASEGTSDRSVPDWLLLTLVCLGQFMVVLDISIVNVALPSIQHDLHFSAAELQWVVNAYTLTFAGFLLLGGRAADLFGRRRLFLIGLGLFTVTSLIGGLAQNQTWLIAAHALQGLGAAILAPATLTILTATFAEGPARLSALGVWSAVASAGASAGALLGGVLTDLLSWRWILFVNVPVGIIAVLAARRYLPESRADMVHRHLDVAGAITVTGGLVALVYAIVRSEQYAWSSAQVLIPLALAVLLLGAFVTIQQRFSSAPLMPLRIFRSRSVAGGNAGHVPAVLRHVRFVVLRDPLHAAGARVQSAPGGTGLSTADTADRCRSTGDRSPGHQVRPTAPHPDRHPGRSERAHLAHPDHTHKHLCRRPARSLHLDRSGDGADGDPGRPSPVTAGCAAGRRRAPSGLINTSAHGRRFDRSRRARHPGGQAHGRRARYRGTDTGSTSRQPSPTATRWRSGSQPRCCSPRLPSRGQPSPHGVRSQGAQKLRRPKS